MVKYVAHQIQNTIIITMHRSIVLRYVNKNKLKDGRNTHQHFKSQK